MQHLDNSLLSGKTSPTQTRQSQSSLTVPGTNVTSSYSNDSYIRSGSEPPKVRATSGGQVELMLDPQRTKVVEVYGFVGVLASYVSWICYLLWAFLPEEILHSLGISYYPNRYWSIALPATLLLIVALYGGLYSGIGLTFNASFDSFRSLHDGFSKPYKISKKLSMVASGAPNHGSSSVHYSNSNSPSVPLKSSSVGLHETAPYGLHRVTEVEEGDSSTTQHESSESSRLVSTFDTLLDSSSARRKDISPRSMNKLSSACDILSKEGHSTAKCPGDDFLPNKPVKSDIPSVITSPVQATTVQGYNYFGQLIDMTTPDIAEIPVTVVNKLLFSNKRGKRAT